MKFINGDDAGFLELTPCATESDTDGDYQAGVGQGVVLRPPKESPFSLDCFHDRQVDSNYNYDYENDVKWFRNGAQIKAQTGPNGKLLNPIYFDPQENSLLFVLEHLINLGNSRVKL